MGAQMITTALKEIFAWTGIAVSLTDPKTKDLVACYTFKIIISCI